MRRAVLELTSSRPVWAIPDPAVEAISQAFGDDWQVINITSRTSSDGDGAGGAVGAVDAAAGAEVYMGWGVPANVVRAATGTLRWVHTAAAGVRGSLTPALRASGAVFTNSRGVQAEPMADWVVAAIGFCARGFHAAVTAQQRRQWAKDEFTDGSVVVREFRDLRVGLVGLGGIGEAVARRCGALGMTVRAVRRRPEADRPTEVSWVGGPDQLESLASESDVLVIAAPRTQSTMHLVNEAVLRALPRGSHVINVARGDVLDERALVRCLNEGVLGGCALDVFASEPLAPDDPLWHHPLVFITPHVSAVSERFWQRETALILDNVRRYLTGRPLHHVVDFELGY